MPAASSTRRRDGLPAFAAPLAGPCPLCGFGSGTYLFARHGARVVRCAQCGLTHLDRPPVAAEAPEKEAWADPADTQTSSTELKAAESYVATLTARGASRSRMLVVAPAGHPFVAAAERAGFGIAARLDMRELERTGPPEGRYESAVVLFQLAQASDPLRALERIHAALTANAVLLLVTPALDSWPARLLRSQWTEWRPRNLFYFDTDTLQSSCLRAGFAGIEWRADRRHYTVDHVYGRAATSPPTLLTRTISTVAALLPRPVRARLKVVLPSSCLVVTARRIDPPGRPLLSIVMPVFNERATFERTVETVLAKECPGIDKEIIIVESRSTDGTRELVERYDGRPGVTVIFEDRPRGKGHAVRTGLARARGTLVLIQDADNEYDVNDYDALLEPLVSFQRAFVLGSRHVGSWKVRRFTDQPGITVFFNLGHVIFGTALNVLFGQRIKDPFTMYKVFRRDCLHGLKFECNRFDFDFELVIKLLRKGYVPLEVPVNYDSRSFQEGKKVSAFRDPLTWIRALVKYRFASIYEDR